MKKAQNLSMNVIIIAAIALLVLVILAVLLFGASGRIDEGTGCAALPNSQCSFNEPTDGNYFVNAALSSTCTGYVEQAPETGARCWQKIGN